MKITDQQFKAAFEIFEASDGYRKGFLAAIESIPDPLPTLRPIAEMSEKVPEGCVRWFAILHSDGKWHPLAVPMGSTATHFIDILLPVESPEDKMRAEFEEAIKPHGWTSERLPDGRYRDPYQEHAWFGYELRAKSTTQP